MNRSFLILILIIQSACSFDASASPQFVFVGDSPRAQFHQSFDRARKRLQNFYSSHQWKTEIDLAKLITQVEIYSSKQEFDQKLKQLSDGKMTSVPKTVVGLADNGILRVVSWPSYQKVHPQDTETDYEKLLTHEMAHQLHIALLKGQEDQMGPIWFFEGFAVLTANQYEDSKLDDIPKTKTVMRNPERGNYHSYGAIVREIGKSKKLPELVEMAKSPEFNSQMIQLLKNSSKTKDR